MGNGRIRLLGVGGAVRAGSTTERVLEACLRGAAARGCETQLLGGDFLGRLPMYDPRAETPTAEQLALVEAVRAADGLILASPGYHGSISGVMKNALDTLEFTRGDPRPYLQDKAVGTIIVSDGAQAGGAGLVALRAIIHALRGWPTPLGAALRAQDLLDEAGECRDPRDAWSLATVADQTAHFAAATAAWRTR